MALITIPTVIAEQVEWIFARGDSVLEFFGGSEQIVQSNNAKFGISFPLGLKAASDQTIRRWKSSLMQLSKLDNNFKLPPPDFQGNAANYIGANPLCVGAQSGLTMSCDGASVSTAVAVEGDPIEIEGQMKFLIADANSDGAGLVTFTFEPALRAPTADNAIVDVKTPELTLRLLEPKIAWTIRKPLIHDIIIQAIEAFPA